MADDATILDNYGGFNLAQRIFQAAGRATPFPADLAPFDEFHVGGRHATGYLFTKLSPVAGQRVLDIGCGLGGAARYAADLFDVHVTGIDLSGDYIDTALALSIVTNLVEQTEFTEGSALAMLFPARSFDMAYSIHAAMNIADKAALYGETRRMLKHGALFGLYDIMQDNDKDIAFPVPWARSQGESFLASARDVQTLLEQAGFEIVLSENRRDAGMQSLMKMRGASDLPGPRIVMGDDYRAKIDNLYANITEEKCAPWLIVARAV